MAIIMYVIIIFTPSFHIVVGILIESTKRVIVIQLVVKTYSSFKVGIATIIILSVGNGP